MTTPKKRRKPVEPEIRPWDRQPNESGPAFEAFVIYRDMGPARSLTKVVERLHKSQTLLGGWSRTQDWVERARLWDVYVDQLAQDAIVSEVIDMRRRHAAVSKLGIQKVFEKFKTIMGADLPLAVAIRLLEVAARVERESRGLPGATIGAQIGGGLGADPEEPEVLGDDEWLGRMAAVAAQAGTRRGDRGAGEVPEGPEAGGPEQSPVDPGATPTD